jgi:nuclear pore complex protein Nup155
VIFESANHRNEANISAMWQYLIEQTHNKVANDPNATEYPYEAVINMFRDMSHRLKNSETTFNPALLIPALEAYAMTFQNGVGPRTWLMDLFIHVGYPYGTIISVLQTLFYNDTAPFVGRNKKILADHILYVCEQWYEDCIRSNQRLFGSEENAQEISQMLRELIETGLQGEEQEQANELRRKIERSFR